jgi:hypothetical protein
MTAIRVCLDRMVPPRKDRTVAFELPKLLKPEDAIAATSALAAAVSAGEITPSEAAELAKVVGSFVQALELHDLAERIARLEEAAKALP